MKFRVSLMFGLCLTSLLPWAVRADDTHHAPIKVYVLDCGHIKFRNSAMFNDTGEYDGQERELSDMCVLVRHPKGNLLWDTGLPSNDRDQNEHNGVAHYVTMTIDAQLAKIGLKPADINEVAISHAHFDHTGNLHEFTHATWLMQRKELAYIRQQPTPHGVNPADFKMMNQVKSKIIDGDYDVFDDGTIRFFRTPGHTPGHQVMMVKLASGNVIFSGDLYHQRESYEHNYIPAFNDSRADSLASNDRITKLMKTYHAKLIIQHDKGDFNSMPVIPKWLE